MQTIDTKTYRKDLSHLFKEYDWNYIPDAILEGSFGKVLVDELDDPRAGVLFIPEFKLHFLGGDPKNPAVRAYLKKLPIFSYVFIGSDGWDEVLEEIHPGKWVLVNRYAFSSDRLDIRHLEQLKDQLPEEYQIKKIDLSLARRIKNEKNELTQDQMFGFGSAEDFMNRGIGYCAFEGDEMVCIGAACAACAQGIEIQINTRKSHQGRGIATSVAAALIMDCLEQGIDPNWDAASEISAGLAKKLGYTLEQEYPTYFYLRFMFLVGLRKALRKMLGKSS